MADHWETAPRHMMRLDIRSLLQDAAIEEVSVLWLKSSAEMNCFSPFLLWKNFKLQKSSMNSLRTSLQLSLRFSNC